MITHASLFSGIGAADLAAEELGWRNVFNCEINEFCRMVLDYHFPDADKYKDIYKVNFRKYEGTINVLSGGFPCQAFSVAGRRKGTDDDRYLWPQMLRAITEIKPDYVLGENVVGILSMVSSIGEPQVAHQASLFGEGDNIVTQRGQYVADIIREDLEREGYTLQIFVIPACAIGAPHQRNRVWFIAKRNATDPINNGLQYNVERGCEGEMFGTQGERRQNGISEQVKPTATTGKGWSIADPKSQQGNRCESGEPTDCRPGQGQFGGGDCKDCDDWQWPIADTDICGDRTQEAHNRTKASRGGQQCTPVRTGRRGRTG